MQGKIVLLMQGYHLIIVVYHSDSDLCQENESIGLMH